MIRFICILISISVFLNSLWRAGYTQDTVKIMTYNILNYGGSDTSTRNPYFRTVIGAANPDILVVEEILSQNAVNIFRNTVMNLSGAGSYLAGVFIDGFDSDNAIFYRPSKFIFLSNTPIRTELRDINEFRLVHTLSNDTIRIYAVHLKANNTLPDQQQRAREVDSLRKVTNTLPSGSNFIVAGDFNIYSSNEAAYQKLLQMIPPYQGHFFDAINITGTWNNSQYAPHHTQSTRVRAFGGGATGGLDDRFDMILYSSALNLPGGITYITQSLTPYGNDGSHYDDSINRPPNLVVSQQVANALHYSSDHLPVYAKFVFENVISVEKQSEIASEFNLYQNYPNPFNPVTKIKFEMPVSPLNERGEKGGFVTLVVYDVLGEQIAVLVDEQLRRGTYEVTWNAESFPSGIYYYSLRMGEFSETKKMILLK